MVSQFRPPVLALACLLFGACDVSEPTYLEPPKDAGAKDGSATSDGSISRDADTKRDLGPDIRCEGRSETTCLASPRCKRAYCQGCGSGVIYVGCYDRNQGRPPCPPIQCPDCTQLPEQECQERQDDECMPYYCSDCDGQLFYAGCGGSNDPRPACPGIACPVPCPSMGEDECIQTPYCHPVYFEDPNNQCGCPQPGCCTIFSSCADGAFADCRGPASCEVVEPRCEGDYTIGYLNECYEGCVRRDDCG